MGNAGAEAFAVKICTLAAGGNQRGHGRGVHDIEQLVRTASETEGPRQQDERGLGDGRPARLKTMTV
jgi:hypothetical protein